MAVSSSNAVPARPAHHDIRLIALVFAGGALGTCTRGLLEKAFPAATAGWPWTTFLINVTGAFVLSFLLETLLRLGPDSGWRRLVRLGGGTGFLGGYTTYSTFAVETRHLPLLVGSGYAIATVVLGVLAAALGWLVANRVVPGEAGHA